MHKLSTYESSSGTPSPFEWRSHGWQVAFFCVSCNQQLSMWQTFYNDGACPHCAHIGENAATITAHSKRLYRFWRPRSWWRRLFWKPRVEVKEPLP